MNAFEMALYPLWCNIADHFISITGYISGFVVSIKIMADHSGRVVKGMNCVRRSKAGIEGSNHTRGMDL
jgi:hypothetical protein